MPFAKFICTTFPESEEHLPADKVRYVGAIVREEIKSGNASKGKAFCNFPDSRPILLVMGEVKEHEGSTKPSEPPWLL